MGGSEVSTSVVKWSVIGWSLNGRKWSVDKCSEVKCSGCSLNGRKWSVDKCSEGGLNVDRWSVVKCSEGLSKRVSNIIRIYISIYRFVCIFLFCELCIFIVIFMYSHCYVCSVLYILFSSCQLTLLATLTEVFRASLSAVNQMPGYNSKILGRACNIPKLIVLFCLLFVCKCVLCYCQRVLTQLQLTNISTYQHTFLTIY